MAEDLVPAACERLLGCGGHPEQDVLDPVASRLRRSREVEAARAVVKEGGSLGLSPSATSALDSCPAEPIV